MRNGLLLVTVLAVCVCGCTTPKQAPVAVEKNKAKAPAVLTKGATHGDINGDGSITQADYILLAQSLVGRIKLTPAQQVSADMNNDKLVDKTDLMLLRAIAIQPPVHRR